MVEKFLEVQKLNCVFCVNGKLSPLRLDGIGALRLWECDRLNCFPYDSPSYDRLKSMHEIITAKQSPPSTGDGRFDLLFAIPPSLFNWFSRYSFPDVEQHWIEAAARFMIKEPNLIGVIFNQSPGVLVKEIQLRWMQHRKRRAPKIKIPRFLNHHKYGGNYKQVMKNYDFLSYAWGLRDDDVEGSDPIADRCESDVEAFTYWKANVSPGDIRWMA